MTTNNELFNKAKEELLTASGDDCQLFFTKYNCTLELAYWKLLHGCPHDAIKLFQEICDNDIRAHWGIFISNLVLGKICGYPSYFELRNFLEIDLNLILEYCLGDYAANIVKYADWLSTINPEVHKFIGRVFLKNEFEEYGIFFLQRAKDCFFYDPELHYLFAEFYAGKNNIKLAETAVKNCLKILPGYYPALNLGKKFGFNCA